MRIISGHARGLKLKAPQGQSIRPTSDRAREALFSIIGNRVKDARVLDLFAGTGAFGLEALSRGASHVTFVDNSPDARMLINQNIQIFPHRVQADSDPEISAEPHQRIFSPLPVSLFDYDLGKPDFFSRNEQNNPDLLFDLIFLDPPYGKGLSLQTLLSLDRSVVLTRGGLVIVEERSGVVLPDSFNFLTISDKRRYGDTAFWFYHIQSPPADSH